MAKQRILLIDYDPTSVARLMNPLSRAGFSVEVAKDGIEGLAAYDRLKPDLVLVEAMLPRKHGFEVCQEIKRRPDGAATPVMITTAVCRGRKYRTDAIQIYGCDEYVEKPIADDELISICHRLLQQITAAAAAGNGDRTASHDAGSKVPALDGMTDAELESRLDALLVDPDEPAPVTVAPDPAPVTVAPDPEPVIVARQAPAQQTASELPDLARMSEDEIMSRLDALVAGAAMPEAHPQVAADPEPITLEPEPEPAPTTEAPFVLEPEKIADEPFVLEPETAQPPAEALVTEPQPSRRVWVGVAAVGVLLLLAGAAFLAVSRGWLGSSASPPPVAAVARPEPEPEAESLTAFLDPVESAEPAQAESEPVGIQVEPEPISAAPQPEPIKVASKPATEPEPVRAASKPPPVKAAPKPRKKPVEPDPEVTASLTAEIVSQPVREPPAEAASALDRAEPETLLGDPVPPVARGALLDLSEVDTEPVAYDKPAPSYDAISLRLRQQGTVELNLLIDESGEVADVQLIGGIPKSRLNDAAIRAARRWRYHPAQKDGVPVKVWKTEKVVFKL